MTVVGLQVRGKHTLHVDCMFIQVHPYPCVVGGSEGGCLAAREGSGLRLPAADHVQRLGVGVLAYQTFLYLLRRHLISSLNHIPSHLHLHLHLHLPRLDGIKGNMREREALQNHEMSDEG